MTLKSKLILAVAAVGMLTGCNSVANVNGAPMRVEGENNGTYCGQHPTVCKIALVAVVGGTAAAIASRGNDNSNSVATGGGGGGGIPGSDVRLKRDIVQLATLQNGIKLYSFRYIWDQTVHVGVMAQDLLRQPAFRSAVVVMDNGYYGVDYAALGLRMSTLDEWRKFGSAAVVSVNAPAPSAFSEGTFAY